MKQHEFRELVNELRDTTIKYHAKPRTTGANRSCAVGA